MNGTVALSATVPFFCLPGTAPAGIGQSQGSANISWFENSNKMQIPERIRGFKWLAALWVVTAVVWSAMEGDLRLALFFGFLTTLAGLAYLLQRIMGGRRFSAVTGLLVMGLWGAALGAGTVLMTLFLMAVKTGLHAHGPEFTMAEIGAVWGQLPLWSLVGLLGGLGLGLLLMARTPESD